jgi:hypothetical protein
MKTCARPSVGGLTRLVASLTNATIDPSAEIAGSTQSSLASASSVETLDRRVTPVARFQTKTSWLPLVSCGTRRGLQLWKATRLPSAESEALRESPPLPCPSLPVVMHLGAGRDVVEEQVVHPVGVERGF